MIIISGAISIVWCWPLSALLFNMLVMALFRIGVVLLAGWSLRNLLITRSPRAELDAEETVKQRFALGGISSEELTHAREVQHSVRTQCVSRALV